MIPDGDGKPESRKTNAEEMARRLELELAQRRVEWAEKSARYRNLRTAAFLFLALVIMGAIAAFFFLFTQLSQNGGPPRPSTTPAATP
jgi:hypothetical protein